MQLARRRWICLVLLALAVGLGAVGAGAIHADTGARDLGGSGTALHDELISFAPADDGIGVAGAPDSRRVSVLGVTIVSAVAVMVVRRWSRRRDASPQPSHGTVVSVGLRAPPHPLLA